MLHNFSPHQHIELFTKYVVSAVVMAVLRQALLFPHYFLKLLAYLLLVFRVQPSSFILVLCLCPLPPLHPHLLVTKLMLGISLPPETNANLCERGHILSSYFMPWDLNDQRIPGCSSRHLCNRRLFPFSHGLIYSQLTQNIAPTSQTQMTQTILYQQQIPRAVSPQSQKIPLNIVADNSKITTAF